MIIRLHIYNVPHLSFEWASCVWARVLQCGNRNLWIKLNWTPQNLCFRIAFRALSIIHIFPFIFIHYWFFSVVIYRTHQRCAVATTFDDSTFVGCQSKGTGFIKSSRFIRVSRRVRLLSASDRLLAILCLRVRWSIARKLHGWAHVQSWPSDLWLATKCWLWCTRTTSSYRAWCRITRFRCIPSCRK